MKNNEGKVLIIGSGPAGYTAAIYAARANLQPILISGYDEGGQLMSTLDVENYPGFATGIIGPDLMTAMKNQAEHVGARIINDMITSVDFSKQPFVLKGENAEYTGQSVIICTGAQAKWLGIPSEEKFRGYGVSGCATCDGFFFKNKEVIVVGGGNTASEEALYMTTHASKVFLVHRRDSLKSERILQDRIAKNPKIEIIWDSEIEEILGNDNPKTVTGARLKNLKTGVSSEMKIDGIFIAIGHKPATEIFKHAGIDLDSEGYIVTKQGSVKTNIEGVFAAGDVIDTHYRQAITAAGMGCMAALDSLAFCDANASK